MGEKQDSRQQYNLVVMTNGDTYHVSTPQADYVISNMMKGAGGVSSFIDLKTGRAVYISIGQVSSVVMSRESA